MLPSLWAESLVSLLVLSWETKRQEKLGQFFLNTQCIPLGCLFNYCWNILGFFISVILLNIAVKTLFSELIVSVLQLMPSFVIYWFGVRAGISLPLLVSSITQKGSHCTYLICPCPVYEPNWVRFYFRKGIWGNQGWQSLHIYVTEKKGNTVKGRYPFVLATDIPFLCFTCCLYVQWVMQKRCV